MTGALPPASEAGVGDHNPPDVAVRYWAAARAAAGVESETVSGATLAEVISAVLDRHPDRRFADVLGTCAILIGEQPAGSRDPEQIRMSAGDTVEFLPPFAGG